MFDIKKHIQVLILALIFVTVLILGTTTTKASSNLYLNNIDFQANIEEDGDMQVTEIWNISIKDTNTLYKTFKRDSEKYSSLTDISVKEISSGYTKNFQQINQLMYHVTKDCYYGLLNDDGDFEIAWGVGLENKSSTRIYEIQYTVKDAITKYNDYAELYWQFIGEEFEISANRVTGTITLPNNVTTKEDIKVWGHTEGLNGEIYSKDLNKVEFELNNFNAGRYVEIRTLFPTSMITSASRIKNQEILNSVIQEETKWANEANAKRQKYIAEQATIKTALIIITILVSIIIIIKFIFNLKKYKKILKTKVKLVPEKEYEYFREIPREDATPAEALSIYKGIYGEISNIYLGQIFTANVLQLSLKKKIQISEEINKKGKEEINITKCNCDIDDLRADERVVYNFIDKIFNKRKSDKISTKEMEVYIRQSTSEVLSLKSQIDIEMEKDLSEKELCSKTKSNELKQYTFANVGYIILILFILLFGLITVLQITPLTLIRTDSAIYNFND